MTIKKKSIYIATFIIELVAVIVLYCCCCEDTEYFNVDTFYSIDEEEVLHYIDSSYDEEKRCISSDFVMLNKGFYSVDVYYQSNFPSDAVFGCSAFIDSYHKGTRILPMERYVYLDDSGSASFEVYIPYDGCDSKLLVLMEDDNGLQFIKDETRYVLVDHAEISKDVSKTALFITSRFLAILVIIDAAGWYALKLIEKRGSITNV